MKVVVDTQRSQQMVRVVHLNHATIDKSYSQMEHAGIVKIMKELKEMGKYVGLTIVNRVNSFCQMERASIVQHIQG